MRVLNSAQMREADRRTIEEIGIPSLVLMENAGRQVVAAIETVHGDLLEGRVAVLCGRGNNRPAYESTKRDDAGRLAAHSNICEAVGLVRDKT